MDWPALLPRGQHPATLNSLAVESIGRVTTGPGSNAWPTSNLAILAPCRLGNLVLVTKLWVLNGAAASGNLDIGIYDQYGNRLVSTGSTAMSGTSAIQLIDVTDTWLPPGFYRLALAVDNTTAAISAAAANLAAHLQATGFTQAATSFPLPATITPAAFTGAHAPFFGALLKRTTM